MSDRPQPGDLLFWRDTELGTGTRVDVGIVIPNSRTDNAEEIRIFWAGADGSGSCSLTHEWPRTGDMIEISP